MTPRLLSIGKVHEPAPWVIGLVTIGLLGAASITYWTLRHQATVPDKSTRMGATRSESAKLCCTHSCLSKEF